MAIPDKVISVWSLRGGLFQPDWTKTVLEEALDGAKRLRGLDYRIILQGSYPNETNIPGSSDVDLVIQLRLPFEEQIDALDHAASERFWAKYGESSYTWYQFREAVLATLRNRFFVHESPKCIDIYDWDSLFRVPADIVPALEYREYSAFPSLASERYEEGVFFRDRDGASIINFPEQHLVNGRKKDRACGGRFKPMVRIFKNARKRCTLANVSDTPSYLVECIVYNIPDDRFDMPLIRAYPACLDWLAQQADQIAGFRCQNLITPLFGPHHRWQVTDVTELIQGLQQQWDRWPPP